MDQKIEIWDPERLEHPEMDDAAFEKFMEQLNSNE
jgi:hypothetical protein